MDEVAAAVQFAPVNLKLVDIGEFHKLLREGYPVAVDQPPLPPSFETFGPTPSNPGLFFPVAGSPWRVWFVSENDEHVVQLQPDRLVANWRIRPGGKPYPRFDEVHRRIKAAFGTFEAFTRDKGLDRIQVNQCNLSYFNKIPLEAGETFGDLGRVIDGFNLGFHAGTQALPFEEASFTAARILRANSGESFARLAVECSPGIEITGERIWRFNISVRGRPLSDGIKGVSDFFDVSHVEIVSTFAAITLEHMHKQWEIDPP